VARIFLCHASEDKAQVREVYHRLHASHGFEPWLDEELLPEQEWAREIPRALQTSDFILIFLSRNSVAKRGYVQRGMKLALDAWQELPEGTIHTIPVRIDDCEVPEAFRRYHWANLFDPMDLTAWFAPYLDAEASDNEKPAHRVTISQPFYLGKYPVTQGQWTAVMGSNPSEYKHNPNHPVESVSWDDVQTFLRKLNEHEGRRDYRLPAEAQWEYACRTGTDTPRYHPEVNAIAWYQSNSNDQTQPVGQKLPNAWGLYDMLGNVWEWCRDGSRTYTADTAVDPMRPTDADAVRVVRGGGWYDSAHGVRAAYRHVILSNFHNEFLGFRCASSGRRR
jgi:hypothetical protein